ncbi:MAG: RNA polymerase sigma factor [Myxococcota bacterium]
MLLDAPSTYVANDGYSTHLPPRPRPRLDEATVRELTPGLIRYARQRVGDELAQDLVQDTWVAAFGAIDKFAGRSSLRTWLISILRRKIIDSHRRRRPQVSFEEHHTPDGDPRRERLDDVAAANLVERELPSLPKREREAVSLVDVAGYDRDVAAEAMGVTRSALRVMLHRGRNRLKKKLESADLTVN